MVYCLAQATIDVPQINIQPQVLKREGTEQQQKFGVNDCGQTPCIRCKKMGRHQVFRNVEGNFDTLIHEGANCEM
jgi:hypothetical protein